MLRRALKYSRFGDPREVVELVEETISRELKSHEVLIRWLASPIHPADINKIQGVYSFKPTLPAIGGSEGFGRVVKTGTSVASVTCGDKAVVFTRFSPCWADLSIVDETDIVKVDQRLTPLQGASLMANPTTAWLMLKMGGLERGDWIIQNAANSAVGRAVIEMAKEKGFHTINVVRDRPDINELKDDLCRIGGDVVWTEEEVKNEGRTFKSRPKVALNGVGGKSCLQISSLLARGGLLITYGKFSFARSKLRLGATGGMSRKAHEISTSSFIFNGIKAVGISNGVRMMDPANRKETDTMLGDIQDMFIRGVLHPPPMDQHPLDNYKTAIESTMDGRHAKQIFVMQEENMSKV